MSKKTKLELTWIGKDKRPRLEPRILLEDPELSYAADHRVRQGDIFDNMLIHGDNLLALKALEQDFTGAFKCVYIDPPFNTQQAFEHYDDGVEHSVWLSLMRERLSIVHRLMHPEGTLFVHIDDNELGYLIVLLDEVFGRTNRVSIVTFKQGSATGHKAINPGCVTTTNFVLMYAKDKAAWKPRRVFTARERDNRYNQFIPNIGDHHSKWRIVTLMTAFAASQGVTETQARGLARKQPDQLDEFVKDNGPSVVRLARPSYDAVSKAAQALIDESNANPEVVFHLPREGHKDFYFIRGERILFYKDKLREIDGQYVAGEPLTTLWDDLLSNNLHNEGGVSFPKGKKPEALIKRVIDLSTEPGDWVLDSFAGSGTTGAVAHKAGRRWVMVELGDHCHTHVLPRLRAVIDGADSSGSTQATRWKGGGGFRFCRLAPSLLEEDKWGNWVINRAYNKEMLAEAMCKIEGFRYEPSPTIFWMHGQSTETDYLYVTTQTLTHEQLQVISAEVGDERTLLICCSAFRARLDQFPNLTVKKIPAAVLERCEWGKDDYSLNVQTVMGEEPEAPEPEPDQSAGATVPPPSSKKRKGRKPKMQELPLFAAAHHGKSGGDQ
ncbi:MAG: site-specific DNA-methyltransferase [Myxococcales bacterium]|nr:site-specific DNA-methyltransferase [Myxococcales bacterium]MCB9544689.1 site-specific DNA-methyltransferase [Myxococcales bacterium]